MSDNVCNGPEECRYNPPKQQGFVSRFFAQHWLPFVIYIFTFGTMVQQNRQSNAMVPQLDDRLTNVERIQGETALIQKQCLDILKSLNDEFRAYKDRDLETSAAMSEITKRNVADIAQLQAKVGAR